MHVLILFLIGVTAYATSRISNTFPRFQAANFGQMMDGKQLNGSVIKEIEVESESSCRLECVNEERCKSYNFGSKKNKPERWKCKISDSDRFERPARANFIENKDFSCRGIKVFALHFKRFWLSSRYTNKVLQRQFPRYLQFCVIFFYLKFGPMNLFYQQALGRAQILIVQQILGNSIWGNAINLAQKIPIFFVAKHYVME